MYSGHPTNVMHRHLQKNKTPFTSEAVSASSSSSASDPIIVRGYESLVIYGKKTGSSTDLEIQVLPVAIDEETVLSNPITSFTLNTSIMDDNVSLAPGRPAIAIKIVNNDGANADVVTVDVVATWA